MPTSRSFGFLDVTDGKQRGLDQICQASKDDKYITNKKKILKKDFTHNILTKEMTAERIRPNFADELFPELLQTLMCIICVYYFLSQL